MSPASDRLLTLREFAARLGVTVRTIYRWIACGDLPQPIKVGLRAVRLPESALDAYLAKRQNQRSVSVC